MVLSHNKQACNISCDKITYEVTMAVSAESC